MCRLLQNVFALFWTLPIIQHLLSWAHIFHGTSCYSLHVFFCFFHNVMEVHICVRFFTTCFNYNTCRVICRFMCFTVFPHVIPPTCAAWISHLFAFFLQHVSPIFHVFWLFHILVFSFCNRYHQLFMSFEFSNLCASLFFQHVIPPTCAAWILHSCAFFLQHVSLIFHVFRLFLIYVFLFPSCVFALSWHLCFSIHVFVCLTTCNSPSMYRLNFQFICFLFATCITNISCVSTYLKLHVFIFVMRFATFMWFLFSNVMSSN